MKLWLLERTDRIGYDEYFGDVVAAETEEEAIKLSVVGSYKGIEIQMIGEAAPGIVAGTILDSFNAG